MQANSCWDADAWDADTWADDTWGDNDGGGSAGRQIRGGNRWKRLFRVCIVLAVLSYFAADPAIRIQEVS